MKKGTISVIEIAETRIAVLHGRVQREGPMISQFSTILAGGVDRREISRRLATMVPVKEVEEDNLVLLIPRRYAILKQFVMPSHSPVEIRHMVGLQVAGHVPFNRDNIVFDILMLEQLADGSTKVLVIVIPKDVIQRSLDTVQQIGILPHTVLLSSLGIAGWHFLRAAQRQGVPEGAGVVIHIDQRSSEVCFCWQDKLLFSRNIMFGSGDLQESQVNGFLEQIGLTLGAYKKENMGPPIKEMVILSDSPASSILSEKLGGIYHVPVLVEDLFQHLTFDKGSDPAALKKEQEGSLIPLAGLLTEPWPKSVNFMPFEILDLKSRRLRRSAMIQLALSAILTLLMIVGILVLPVYQDGRYLKQIESEISELNPAAAKAEKKMEFFNFIKGELENRIIVVDIIKEFYGILPEDMSLKVLNLDRTGALDIEGLAQTGSEVNKLQNGLVNSPLFKEVNLQYATKRRRFNEEYTDFKIICRLANKSQVGK